ncbi:hypothetical protein [Liquorilactobacillus mali]|uniref:Uncharacterized protein n=1 Tax=Liquorilactobacillus mali KCTC 3596 = DSM 20444 TaxID=1046596 RepID=J0UPZ3_9LACO|nr:hypothetical protein [Liquorilactobacillus mali]EJE97751.1 hypothetical protein LMA_09168 [Liquorilactobacillus mali KCTC 3596 = DSM 20444]KRN10840.1 hypothetical protein FD00_GL002083 [Liquorilactobacillus mali KCTC 3596 = DSM 20444]
MTQPVLNYVGNFDAKDSITFTYIYLGAERSTSNMISIRENVGDNPPVYEKEVVLADKEHTLPAGTLEDGKAYLAKIKVKTGDTWSDWSSEIEFMCLDKPNIVFDTIDSSSYVYNDDILMSVLYTQAQGDTVNNYQFKLYDQNHILINTYPVRVPPTEATTRFSERFSGLIKGKLYYASITVNTSHDINYTIEKQFTPQYIVPTISGILQPLVVEDQGQVMMEMFLKQILGTPVKPYIPNRPTDSETYYTYYNNDYVVIPQDNPLMFTKLGMAKASDFVAKVWCMNVLNGTFLDFAPELGNGIHIKFIKYDDYIVCEKTFGSLTSRTKSNIVTGLGLKEFYLYIKVKEFRIEMEIALANS